jgi:hypothetical protein
MTKMRLASLIAGFAISLGASSFAAVSYAQEIQILDIITDKQLEELDIEIPEETPVGYNELIIDVYEENDVIISKRVGFCKEADGFINWNNKCPEPVTVAEGEPILEKVARSLDAEDALLVSLLALAAVILFGSFSLGIASDVSPLPRYLAQGSLAQSLSGLARSVSQRSLFLARIVDDGTWLRSRVGHGTLALYLASAGLAVYGLNQNSLELVPLSLLLTLGLLFLSTLDALAGLYGSVIFILSLFIAGSVEDSLDAVFLILFLSLSAFARPLAEIFVRSLSSSTEDGASTRSEPLKVGVLVGLFSYLILELMPYTLSAESELVGDGTTVAIIAGGLAFLRLTLSRPSEVSVEAISGAAESRSPRGRALDILIAVALAALTFATLFAGTIAMWPSLILIALVTLLGLRKSARVN